MTIIKKTIILFILIISLVCVGCDTEDSTIGDEQADINDCINACMDKKDKCDEDCGTTDYVCMSACSDDEIACEGGCGN